MGRGTPRPHSAPSVPRGPPQAMCLDPPLGTAEDTNFKFGIWIDDEEARMPIQKVAKLCQLETEPESCCLFFNYATSSISTERLKIETSYLVRSE